MLRENCEKDVRDNTDKTDYVQKRLLAAILIILVVLLLLVIGIFIIIFVTKKNETVDTFSEKENPEYSEVPESEDVEISEESIVAESEEQEEEYQLLVSVPVDTMSLRINPGLGDDVVEEFGPGVYLKYYGDSQMVEDREFYQVTVQETGQKGFVAANSCTPVDFLYDEGALNIVDVSNSLYTYNDMVDDLQKLSAEYSDVLSYDEIGTSADGRILYAAVLGNSSADTKIFVQAGIHGREYMSTQLVMKMMEYYAHYYHEGTYHGTGYEELLNSHAIVIVPMSNPDGVSVSQFGEDGLQNSEYADILQECYERDKEYLVYEEDINGDMNWSDYSRDQNFDRSSKPNQDIISYEDYLQLWKSNINGVDLNRNFDAGWEEIEESPMPAYSSFKGDYPVSEPESQALVELAQRDDFKYYISYHAKGQLIYYDAAGNLPEVSDASFNLASTVQEINKYAPVNTQKGYHVVLGGFGDWIQLGLNKPSITIEIGKHPCPLAIEEFQTIFLRNREVWAKLCYEK